MVVTHLLIKTPPSPDRLVLDSFVRARDSTWTECCPNLTFDPDQLHMQRKKVDRLRLKRKAPQSAEWPSARSPTRQGFRSIISVNESTRELLCSLLLKNLPTTLPPLPPSKLLLRSAGAGDADLQDSVEEPEVQEKTYTWTPLPPPNMKLLTRKPAAVMTLEQLCGPEPMSAVPSETCQLSAVSRDNPTTGEGNNRPAHPLQSEDVEMTVGGVSESQSADVLMEEGGGSDLDLFDDEELELVWRDVDLSVGDGSSDSSDGLPAVNLGGSQEEPPGTSRCRQLTTFEEHWEPRTLNASRTTAVSQVVTASTSCVHEQPKASGRPLSPKTGNNLSRSTATYPSQNVPKSVPDHRVSQPPEAKVNASNLDQPSGSVAGREDSASRPPLVTDICPMCGTKFPHGFSQLDADHHIALCLESSLLLDDVTMLD